MDKEEVKLIEFSHKCISSSFIKEIRYSYLPQDDKKITERLRVIFHDGMDLEYRVNEAENLYKDFISSSSVGKFYHKNIKDKFECKVLRKSIKI